VRTIFRQTRDQPLYRRAKVVFATPQRVWNDLKSGLLRLDDVSLIVFDEAHRARGNYAYVGIAASCVVKHFKGKENGADNEPTEQEAAGTTRGNS
jgi:ERCC4-related helicase